MYPNEYQIMRSVEDTYWWYAGLRSLVLENLQKLLRGKNAPAILDAGCGTGGLMQILGKELQGAKLIGIDASDKAIDFTRKRNTGYVARASVNNVPFPGETFDIVISLDVLYMQGIDETKALKEFYRVLKPAGYLILNLPAFELLRGSHDRAIKTARRYTKKGIRLLLIDAQFQADTLMYWNSTLFPAMAVWRPVSGILSNEEDPRSDLKQLPAFANSFLTWMIRKELHLLKYISCPFGSSVFAIARKAPPQSL